MNWILDHPRDLLADFLRFYGRRPEEFPGPDMLALAYRVSVYGGMIAARIEANRPKSPTGVPNGARMVEPTKAAILADPLLREVIEVG